MVIIKRHTSLLKAWSVNILAPHRREQSYIIGSLLSGVTSAGTVQTVKASFELYIKAEMLDIIMSETNREAERL